MLTGTVLEETCQTAPFFSQDYLPLPYLLEKLLMQKEQKGWYSAASCFFSCPDIYGRFAPVGTQLFITTHGIHGKKYIKGIKPRGESVDATLLDEDDARKLLQLDHLFDCEHEKLPDHYGLVVPVDAGGIKHSFDARYAVQQPVGLAVFGGIKGATAAASYAERQYFNVELPSRLFVPGAYLVGSFFMTLVHHSEAPGGVYPNSIIGPHRFVKMGKDGIEADTDD